VLTHCDFATTTETAAFAYPFVGVGGACLPGFGFGF
jgi:enoyl-CoA hydratase/carnithine racemase